MNHAESSPHGRGKNISSENHFQMEIPQKPERKKASILCDVNEINTLKEWKIYVDSHRAQRTMPPSRMGGKICYSTFLICTGTRKKDFTTGLGAYLACYLWLIDTGKKMKGKYFRENMKSDAKRFSWILFSSEGKLCELMHTLKVSFDKKLFSLKVLLLFVSKSSTKARSA